MTSSQPQPLPRNRRVLGWLLIAAFIAIPIAEVWVVTSIGGLLGL